MTTLAIRDADNNTVFLDGVGAGDSSNPFIGHHLADEVMASTFFSTQVTVTSIGQIVQLPAFAPQRGILIKAMSTNQGQIFLGGPSVSSTNGFELDKSQSIVIRIDELSKLYVTSTAANENVCILAM